MSARRVIIHGREQIDPRQTRAWTKLRDQVVREEPHCWLRLTGCTGRSQTADHVVPVATQPELAMERANLRGACHHCNTKRKSKPIMRTAVWVL
jgi:5-methylcytosine-specific restriction endonuclease McrA